MQNEVTHHDNELKPTDAAAAGNGAGGSAPLAVLQEKLAAAKGKRFWKAFEQIAETDEFRKWIEDEFPNRQELLNVDRRQFLKIGGAALALAGLTGCRILPQVKAVPYVRAPEEVIPGLPVFYASTLLHAGYGVGVMVESHEGRPTKVEGNPRHPASLGATDIYQQAETLNLYDPDRSQSVIHLGEAAAWDEFANVARSAIRQLGANGGAGIRILTETVTSPTLAAQLATFLARYPSAKWHRYEPVGRENVYEGTRLAFGKPLNPVYRLKNAAVIVALDGDFLKELPGNLRYARDFADGRRIRKGVTAMNRLYAFDSSYTITGVSADHRFPIKPSDTEAVARALYSAVTGDGTSAPPASVKPEVIAAIAADLKANAGRAVIIPGEQTSPAVHALAHAMNGALGAYDKTVYYTAPVEAHPEDGIASLKTLTDDINAGQVQALFILGGNPVFQAPADIKLGDAIMDASGKKRVPLVARLGIYDDETSYYADWHIAESHPLEAWGDARAYDGTVSVVQPLIAPLYDSRSAIELMAELLGEPQPGYDVVRGYHEVHTYRAATGALGFDKWFETVLYNGVVPNSALPAVAVTAPAAGFVGTLPPAPAASANGLDLKFMLDPSIWDGRHANNSWLQELPKPITTLTWDNAAIVSPQTAKTMGLLDGGNTLSIDETDARDIARYSGKSMIEIDYKGLKALDPRNPGAGPQPLQMPVYILPGHPDNVITLYLGFGRWRSGNVGTAQGFNVHALRTSDAMGYGSGASVKPTGGEYIVSYTQSHHLLYGINEPINRDIVHAGTFEQFTKEGEIGVAVENAPGAKEPEGHEHIPLTNDPANMGPASSQGEVRPADPYRQMWEYADKGQSNRSGFVSAYPEYSGREYNQWAMTVDMTVCIGCNACIVACQAENNVPTVGKDEVGRGRQMQWLRIDHYFAGSDLTNVESHFMPMYCQHCEKAPCEPVCPVAATIHSHEGLNQMVYNRCIGTRYCSNNCPYKVRRFNFFKWIAGHSGPTTVNFDLPVVKNLANPDVTVRGRGVMEKCSYCVQRINAARIKAKKEFREIQDGEIVTACQQACPTRVFSFGDINDPNSEVSRLRAEPHNYSVLEDLNTRPRTTYLARVKNINPDIEKLLNPSAPSVAQA